MTDTSPSDRSVAFVLGGGNALGAFQAGACCGLLRGGVNPDRIVGSSIGAVNGALIAGNPPDRRIAALEEFWAQATLPLWAGAASRAAGQALSMLAGNPAVYVPTIPGMIAAPMGTVGLYDLTPLRRSLARLVDFGRLNDGGIRFTAVAVDLETGGEVLFDTARAPVTAEHIAASCAMVPEFKPVEIDGRTLGDGGLTSNLPLDVLLREPEIAGWCVTIDPFSAHGHPFHSITEAIVRRQEILFANHARHLRDAADREEALRAALRDVLALLPAKAASAAAARRARGLAQGPRLERIDIAWHSGAESGARLYDYSADALETRWTAGVAAAAVVLGRLRPESAGG
ncbi:patatin-like phospholipase family protein [Caenispirillum bisanense]|uniref:patatin-like phospholipase family protein n=1 Tax=Caenispirillum bisanense TaxID=414052 RepID=UPI0031E17391